MGSHGEQRWGCFRKSLGDRGERCHKRRLHQDAHVRGDEVQGEMYLYPYWICLIFYRTRNLPYDKSGQTMVCAGGKDKDACQVSQFKCNHFFLFCIINLMFMDRETVEAHLCVKEMSLVGKSVRNVFMAS